MDTNTKNCMAPPPEREAANHSEMACVCYVACSQLAKYGSNTQLTL